MNIISQIIRVVNTYNVNSYLIATQLWTKAQEEPRPQSGVALLHFHIHFGRAQNQPVPTNDAQTQYLQSACRRRTVRLIAGAGPSVPSVMLPEPARKRSGSGAFIAVAPRRRQVATSPPVMGGAAGTLLCKVSGAFIAVAPSPSEARPAGAEPPVPSTALPETALCAGSGAFLPDFINRPPVQFHSCIFARRGRSA